MAGVTTREQVDQWCETAAGYTATLTAMRQALHNHLTSHETELIPGLFTDDAETNGLKDELNECRTELENAARNILEEPIAQGGGKRRKSRRNRRRRTHRSRR
jgi:hypothetical protein